ncbi:hypothetical protein ABIB94_009208 [Bradyrhizobium sp. JR7.2]
MATSNVSEHTRCSAEGRAPPTKMPGQFRAYKYVGLHRTTHALPRVWLLPSADAGGQIARLDRPERPFFQSCILLPAFPVRSNIASAPRGRLSFPSTDKNAPIFDFADIEIVTRCDPPVNRAALRLGRAASIPRAKGYRAPRRGHSGKGPAVMKYAGVAITAPFPGALLTGLVAALGPACRLRRRYAHAPAGTIFR